MSCQHCGKCCKEFLMTFFGDEDSEKFWALHGFKTYRIHENSFKVKFEHRCTWLSNRHDNRCRKYDSRPQVCRDYLCEEAHSGEEEGAR